MTDFTVAKLELQQNVKKRFGKPLSSLKSFEELANNCNVSTQTLRRFFGKIEHNKELGVTSLSQLSRYAGFSDWPDFLEKQKLQNEISLRDRISIDDMSVFFTNGKKYNLEYHQNTISVDILNEYVKVIYRSKSNFLYFYDLYCDNSWVCDYIFAWLPNYNWFGQNWFRKLMFERISKTDSFAVKVALSNFLFLGEFLSEGNVDNLPALADLKHYYFQLQVDSTYMPYHDMRYHTVLMIQAQKNGETEEFYALISAYLENIDKSDLKIHQKQELLLFFCNTLIWLNKFETAYDLLQRMKSFPKNFAKSEDQYNPVHYFGLNPAFIKTTFGLVWLANGNANVKIFDLEDKDIATINGLLYDDYIKVMYLAQCILKENSVTKKKVIFQQLIPLVEKTNYSLIYKTLQKLDPKFSHYSS